MTLNFELPSYEEALMFAYTLKEVFTAVQYELRPVNPADRTGPTDVYSLPVGR
jgi:hypothetical protein